MLVAVPTTDGTVPVAPPKTPWQLALNRFLAGLAVLAPMLLTFVADPLVTYLSGQTITLPDAWKQYAPVVGIVASGLVNLYQSWRKNQKEEKRAAAANTLVALGVPVGIPLEASEARKITAP